MSDPLLREMDHYVVLEPGGADTILTADATRAWLARHLATMRQLPEDLCHLPDDASRAERLLETACALELGPGMVIQWFAVRLERSESR
jgi:hypothetical protein